MSNIKCPHCGKDLDLEAYVINNVDAHPKERPAVARANCCGKAVKVSAVIALRVVAYEGNQTVDDWNVPFEKAAS